VQWEQGYTSMSCGDEGNTRARCQLEVGNGGTAGGSRGGLPTVVSTRFWKSATFRTFPFILFRLFPSYINYGISHA
jgi:hypothetical protein